MNFILVGFFLVTSQDRRTDRHKAMMLKSTVHEHRWAQKWNLTSAMSLTYQSPFPDMNCSQWFLAIILWDIYFYQVGQTESNVYKHTVQYAQMGYKSQNRYLVTFQKLKESSKLTFDYSGLVRLMGNGD